ncbi:MAG: pyridoxal-dependent decarboxylase [Pirellulaceae bacterium]|nr:pyridoxal-dependent decarboxylase [Pirellulaceae bacterium]
MTPDEFRNYGHKVVERVARYLEDVESFPVQSQVQPGWVRGQLPSAAPDEPEPFDQILADVDRIIVPGLTHWQSPNFFAFFPANHSGPSILAELMTAGFGVQGMMWATSPACTELESHVLDWLVDMLALPMDFKSTSLGGGVIQDSASSSALCALLAARERAGAFNVKRGGLQKGLTCYASREAHSSIEKAVQIAGLGSDQLRLIDVDDQFALRPDALEMAILKDLDEGRHPTFVCATIGTTSSQAMDPLQEIGAICRRHQVWFHVDAAMCGTAAICPEFRNFQEGLELCDSYCWSPNKWMFVNFDCNCMWVADREPLIRALSIQPEYLRNSATERGDVIDYRDWQIPLGRRFRALKLWFTIRSFGVRNLRDRVRNHVALAKEVEEWIAADSRFELAAPRNLNLVCFRLKDGDRQTEELLHRLNTSGMIYLTHTRLNDKFTLRLSIGQTETQRQHVERAWKLIQQTADF